MLSYPKANDRGFYLGRPITGPLDKRHAYELVLGIWSAMRNSGSVIGGAINFSTNHSTASAGGIAWSTYLIFVGFGESRPDTCPRCGQRV